MSYDAGARPGWPGRRWNGCGVKWKEINLLPGAAALHSSPEMDPSPEVPQYPPIQRRRSLYRCISAQVPIREIIKGEGSGPGSLKRASPHASPIRPSHHPPPSPPTAAAGFILSFVFTLTMCSNHTNRRSLLVLDGAAQPRVSVRLTFTSL